MKSLKLRNHPGCQCHVNVIDKNHVQFVSYYTSVIEIMQDKQHNRLIKCNGTYSRTTSRQITWFLQEYAPDLTLNDMKSIIGKGFVNC